jgi:Uma2 family endonuclease
MLRLETPKEVNFSLQRRYTLAEFWALPNADDGAHYNLIGGYLYLVPRPDAPHGNLVWRMTKALFRFLFDNNSTGSVTFPTEPICDAVRSTYLEPDLTYVSKGLRGRMGPTHTSADIVVECLSEDTAVYDCTTKADTYLALGVKELWLVDPVTLTIEVRNPAKVDDTLIWEIYQYSQHEHAKSRVLDGWEVSVDEIFEDVI